MDGQQHTMKRIKERLYDEWEIVSVDKRDLSPKSIEAGTQYQVVNKETVINTLLFYLNV